MTKPDLKLAVETNPLTEALVTPTVPDPFDAKALALPPDFFAVGGTSNPKPKNVQVRKPHNQCTPMSISAATSAPFFCGMIGNFICWRLRSQKKCGGIDI